MSTQPRRDPPEGGEPLGLRERKKRETRLVISAVATRMFIARGFENVTMAEVAAEAGVSVTTVFNYFTTKEELFFDRGPEVAEASSRIVRERRRGESAIVALRRSFRKAMKGEATLLLSKGIERFLATIEASPALKARERILLEESERLLVATFAEETGARPDDPTARAVAAMIIGVEWMILQEFRRRILAGEPDDVVRAALSKLGERSFDLLLAAAGDYCVRPSDD